MYILAGKRENSRFINNKSIVLKYKLSNIELKFKEISKYQVSLLMLQVIIVSAYLIHTIYLLLTYINILILRTYIKYNIKYILVLEY